MSQQQPVRKQKWRGEEVSHQAHHCQHCLSSWRKSAPPHTEVKEFLRGLVPRTSCLERMLIISRETPTTQLKISKYGLGTKIVYHLISIFELKCQEFQKRMSKWNIRQRKSGEDLSTKTDTKRRFQVSG